MSVVGREARRRWLLVGGAALALCLLPAVVAALPAGGHRDTDPAGLRRLVLASATKPYQGYVDSQARFGVPDLPQLGEIADLFGASTRMRAWYATSRSWRVAVLDATGERDIYRTSSGTHVWDFERNQVTETIGDLPVRLPSPADLLPPDLARRLLGAAANDPVDSLPPRRVAGVRAAGLRTTPKDPDTTIGRVDVWADPVTGLPVQVEVTGRGATAPVLVTRFLELAQSAPDQTAVTPARPPDAGLTVVSGAQVRSVLGQLARRALPSTLAGRAKVPTIVEGLGVYGTGSSAFVVLALPGQTGARMVEAARKAGAAQQPLGTATAYEMRASVLSMVLVRREGDRNTRRTFLLAGMVTPDLLTRAGGELLR